MKIRFANLTANTIPFDSVLIVPVGEDKKLGTVAKQLDKESGGAIAKAVASKRFSGKPGQYSSVVMPAKHKTDRVILAGFGKAKDLDLLAIEKLGGGAVPHVEATGSASATFIIEPITGMKPAAKEAAAHIAHGAHLRSWHFDKYFTKKTPEEISQLKGITVAVANSAQAANVYKDLEKLAEGVLLTREVVSEPANVIYPESLAQRCMELKSLGVEVHVFKEAQMKKLGFGALLGVGQGSTRESHMVVMKYNGLGKASKKAPLAFVGKGVTFDTGGISIKPAAGMEEMKWDMGGAGTVIGLMKALAGRKAKVNVVGAIGLVENMPDGNAQRPGDVVTSYSGQTIEVLNTDAEGRLVLADVLWYTQKHFKPQCIIDLATLTGAIIIALGSSRAGMFSNNDKIATELFNTGKKVGEEVWRLPLADVYDKQINSDIADMQNIGREREAGSITAAQFLQRFVNDVPWAHLDIAGTAWSKKASSLYSGGATGFGVRLLNQWVADHYE
ncbi:MAG: leucyl aminopeptidase [Alphaproteobacteria bacterium]